MELTQTLSLKRQDFNFKKKNKKETSFSRSHQIHVSKHKTEESGGLDVNNDTAALGWDVKTKWFYYEL